MPREKAAYSSTTRAKTEEKIRERRESVTDPGKQRTRQGLGLDPLVDPKTHGCSRESVNLLVQQPDGTWKLIYGVAMGVKTGLDTTGSVGQENIDTAFRVIPTTQKLLVSSQTRPGLLARYHAQFATAMIQDQRDNYAHAHTEFEPDNEVDNQMRKLDVNCAGGDGQEEYLHDLWYTAYRIKTSIRRYGLKPYYFIVGDERGRSYLSPRWIERTFGITIQSPLATTDLDKYDYAPENLDGWMPQRYPNIELSELSPRVLGQKVLESWHPFFLQIGSRPHTTAWWRDILGENRLITLPSVDSIAEIQAVIIGLTESTLNLQEVPDFLMEVAGISREEARRVQQAVSHIPMRAQALLPNFNKIPPAGSIFKNRDDLWPIGHENENPNAEAEGVTTPGQSEEINWQL